MSTLLQDLFSFSISQQEGREGDSGTTVAESLATGPACASPVATKPYSVIFASSSVMATFGI